MYVTGDRVLIFFTGCGVEGGVGLVKWVGWGYDVGVVRVCASDGHWKRVCDDAAGWTTSDSVVTCRQLGYPYPERAESLGSHLQTWVPNSSNDTVPGCHGDESRLNDCPARAPPTDCSSHGALVNCSRCNTSDVVAFTASLVTRSTPLLLPSPLSSPHTLTSSPITTITSPQLHTITSTTDTIPMATPMQSSTANAGAVETTLPIYSLNSVTIRIIGGVTTGIVSAGLITCLFTIVCAARRRRRSRQIVLKENEAYVELKKFTKQQQVSDPGPVLEPIYENIE